jgi:hypothetical protein
MQTISIWYCSIRATHIVPGELIKRGYPYQTDIEEGLCGAGWRMNPKENSYDNSFQGKGL